jgi:hypothetical protein
MMLRKMLSRLLLSTILAIPTGALAAIFWNIVFHIEYHHPLWTIPLEFIPSALYAMFYFTMSIVFITSSEGRQAHEWIAVGFAINLLLSMPWARLKTLRISD